MPILGYVLLGVVLLAAVVYFLNRRNNNRGDQKQFGLGTIQPDHVDQRPHLVGKTGTNDPRR